MGGQVKVESKEGEGTNFIIFLKAKCKTDEEFARLNQEGDPPEPFVILETNKEL